MSEPVHVPLQWHSVEGPGVTVEVPVDVTPLGGPAGGGSMALGGGGVTVILDGSPSADPLFGNGDQADFLRSEEVIDGRPADVVSFRSDDGTRVVGTRLGEELTAVVLLEAGIPEQIAHRVLHSIRTPGGPR